MDVKFPFVKGFEYAFSKRVAAQVVGLRFPVVERIKQDEFVFS